MFTIIIHSVRSTRLDPPTPRTRHQPVYFPAAVAAGDRTFSAGTSAASPTAGADSTTTGRDAVSPTTTATTGEGEGAGATETGLEKTAAPPAATGDDAPS